MTSGAGAVLYDLDGDPMSVEGGTAIPAGTSSLISAGSDGTNAKYIKVDSSGNQIMVGLGTAGSPSGGLITIQGAVGGTAIPISGSVSITGSVTTTNVSIGSNGAAIPTSSTQIGGSDGTNLQALRVFDADTGGGTQYILGVGLRKFASGGSVELGTSSDPIRIDPTGTTPQPASQSGTWTVQPGNTANTTPWLITINQGGNSATVTASNALKVDGSGVTQPISGTVTANAGTGTFTVSGTVTANAGTGNFTNASIGSTGSAVPASASYAGFSDGTNLQGARVFDVDTGGGTQYVQGVSLRLSAGGGSVEFGTNSNPIRIDPTGTTIQPVSGTVTSNIGTTNGLALDATLAKLTIAQGTALGTNTQALMGASVTTASPSYTTGNINPLSLTTAGALRIDGSATTQPISGTVTANAGTGNFTVVQSTASNLRSQTSSESNTGSAVPTQASMVGGSDGTNLRAIFVDSSGRQIVIGAAASGAAVTGNPVLVAGSDGTNARSIRTATDGTVRVDPTGTTTQPVSGTGNFTVVQSTASNLRAQTSSESNTGSAVPTQAAMIGGTDGTNLRALSVDTSGRPVMVGAAADGAAVTGNPVLIAGQDGTNVQSILTDTSGRIVTASAASAATNGFSNGEMVLASTTTTAVRGTTYTEPSSGAQRSMASSSASDTSAGTGARTVKITYYTLSAGTVAGPFTETITLNGTANVNTVATNICFIEKLEVITVGSGGVNAGTISLFGATAGGGGTVWTIGIGLNKTFGAHHYVPSNKTCSITAFSGGIKGADTSGFILRAKDPTNANAAENQINDLLRAPSSGNTPVRNYAAPIKITGPSRITAFAVPDSSSSRTYYSSFDFYEE